MYEMASDLAHETGRLGQGLAAAAHAVRGRVASAASERGPGQDSHRSNPRMAAVDAQLNQAWDALVNSIAPARLTETWDGLASSIAIFAQKAEESGDTELISMGQEMQAQLVQLRSAAGRLAETAGRVAKVQVYGENGEGWAPVDCAVTLPCGGCTELGYR